MQLVIVGDAVHGWYGDAVAVRMADLPAGAVVVPYDRSLEALGRVGAEPPPGVPDLRPYRAPLAIDLAAYAALKRYYVETGGIVVAGATVATDLKSQTRISNAYQYVQASGAASVSYKSPAGFVTLTAEQVKPLALAVGAHVQACFKAEDDAEAAITSGAAKTIADVDAFFAGLGSASAAPVAA